MLLTTFLIILVLVMLSMNIISLVRSIQKYKLLSFITVNGDSSLNLKEIVLFLKV